MPSSSLVPTAPQWKFKVEAAKTSSGNSVVAVLVASGIPLAVLDAERARKIARALNKAADSIDGGGDDEFPVLSGAIL